MAYRKRKTSPEKNKADKRLAGIKQFETKFDFGNGLTEEAYTASIKKVADLSDQHSELLSQVDDKATALDKATKELSLLSSRVLNAVGGKYSYDSIEYEKAGGIRKSDIKRAKKTKAAKLAK